MPVQESEWRHPNNCLGMMLNDQIPSTGYAYRTYRPCTLLLLSGMYAKSPPEALQDNAVKHSLSVLAYHKLNAIEFT